MSIRNRRFINYITAGALALGIAAPAFAQVERQTSQTRPQVEQPAAPVYAGVDASARETRERFKELLSNYPPALGRIFKLDPTLMLNEAYLATYPAIAAFLKQHPEIARNPSYFLEHVWITNEDYKLQESYAIRVWNNLMEGVMVIGIIALIASVLTWLIRTVIDYRRWSRLSKVQAEVNNKLFDRFSANEDLLAYIQSPAGRRFLEAAPIVTSAGPRPMPMGAPTSRILLSVQAGIIIGITALGVLFISGRVIDEVAQPLFAIATIGISLGVGFVVSSAVAYVLSRNMGLIEPPPAAPGRPGAESNG